MMKTLCRFAGAVFVVAVMLAFLSVAPSGAQTQAAVTISGSTDYGIPCPETGTVFPTGTNDWKECDLEITGVPEMGQNQITIQAIEVVTGGEDTTTTITCHTTHYSCHHGDRIVAYLVWDWDAGSRGTTGHWDVWIQLEALASAGIDKFKVTAGSAVYERAAPLPECGTDETPGVDDCATPTALPPPPPPPPTTTPPPPPTTTTTIHPYGDHICLDNDGNLVDTEAGVWADNNGNDADGNVGEKWVSAGNTC